MADFVGVLRKTIDGLGEATPEMRARVYEKARATVTAKLAAVSPPPPPAVIERQKQALEQAIVALEAEFGSQKAMPAATAPSYAPPSAPVVEEPAFVAPAPEQMQRPEQLQRIERAEGEPRQLPPIKARGRNSGRIAVALIALLFVGSASYAVWLNRDEVTAMLGDEQPAAPAETPAPPQDVAAAPPQPEPAPAPAAPEPAPEVAQPKFTQRLTSEGTEVDPGPAGGADSVGEGTSVALASQQSATPPVSVPSAAPAPADATAAADPEVPADATPEGEAETAEAPAEAAPVEAAPAEPAPAAATPAAEAAVPVGQRAIFYEEQTSNSQGTAEQGSTVWSLVQESPGGDLPAEAAIRGETTIPGKNVQLRMTIRRNGDRTLPASHIVELIFLTPDNFEGGVIDNVLRMTMKDTEGATGTQLLGLPAKIGDGFFLIALGDTQAERDANLQLFRRTKWIDVPIVYRSGRRALITMERGLPGDRAFEDALKAWAATSG